MSVSSFGTKKTTNSIDFNSSKYISRECLGQTKRGVDGETDAAHIFSYGLMNTIGTHTPGRPITSSLEVTHRSMNHDSNLRIKSQYGNRVLDERRDARIANAFVNKEAIQGNSTATRAFQAYQSASSFTVLEAHATALGNMNVYNSETHRTHKLKNHHKY
jgi:hypothetical protein